MALLRSTYTLVRKDEEILVNESFSLADYVAYRIKTLRHDAMMFRCDAALLSGLHADDGGGQVARACSREFVCKAYVRETIADLLDARNFD